MVPVEMNIHIINVIMNKKNVQRIFLNHLPLQLSIMMIHFLNIKEDHHNKEEILI